MRKAIKFLTISALIASCQNTENKKIEAKVVEATPTVTIVGEMRNVMHKGELFGTINLDTISNKNHLYALAPLEYLKGEILILDGKCYVSKVLTDSTMSMEETYKVKAPFFVSCNVEKWYETSVPDSVQDIHQLESFLNEITKNSQRPFAFKIEATVDSVDIHIVNLPDGTKVHSPEEAHQNQETYKIINNEVEIVGFFSTEHAGVFIHHDSFVHMHLITKDRKQMGHIDKMLLTKGTIKLYLPQKIEL